MAKATAVIAKPKSAAANEAKPAKQSSAVHPPYFEMITEAILSLKERSGSSQQAIAKFIEEKYKSNLPFKFKKILSVQLKKFAKSEKLTKVKNSFKCSASVKPKVAAIDVKEKKASKSTSVKKGGEEKKATPKKMKRLSKVVTPKKRVSTPKKLPKSVKTTRSATKMSKV